jgi:hypothetical protein
MTDQSPIHQPDDEEEPAPPRRPVRLGRSEPGDHYGVVRADPPADDHRHDETSPSFLLGVPAPQPDASPQPPPTAEPSGEG